MNNRNEDGYCKKCGAWMCDCAMVINTEPPEKVYLAFRPDGSLDWEWSSYEGDVEYHLAPVWHDAKEPPEKNGDYLVTIQPPDNGRRFVTRDFFEGGKFVFGDYVVAWKPVPAPFESLPQPPEDK